MPTTSVPVPEPVRVYLDALDRVSAGLTRNERQDLRARVWAEVAEAVGPGDAHGEGERADQEGRIEAALTRLGTPAELAGTGEGEYPLRDPVVVHLLGCSLLTFGVAGLAGLVRVWRSPSWPWTDALAATVLVLAGGTALPLLTPVPPVPGALLGGLGVGALLAACVLGARMLLARRRARLSRPGYPLGADATPDTPRGGGGSAPSGRRRESPRSPESEFGGGPVTAATPTTNAPVDSKESG